MALTERLAVVIDANTGGAVREFGRVGRAADKLGADASAAERRVDHLARSSKISGAALKAGLVTGATAAGFALGRLALSATQTASAVAEQASKVGVVFGQHAKLVTKFADEALTSVGLSRRAALEATGTFGNLFTAVGIGQGAAAGLSIKLTTLARDLASFNDVPIDDALAALRSGLVGETEPLKRFGVNLNEATLKEEALRLGLIETSKGTLPAAIKAQAAYSLILEQTKTAQGDYTRTSGSLANQQKDLAGAFENLQEQLGKHLLPALTDATAAANKFFGFLDEHPAITSGLVSFAKYGSAALAVNYALKAGIAVANSTLVTTTRRTVANYALARSEGAVAVAVGRRAAAERGGIAGRLPALTAGQRRGVAVGAGAALGFGVAAARENTHTGGIAGLGQELQAAQEQFRAAGGTAENDLVRRALAFDAGRIKVSEKHSKLREYITALEQAARKLPDVATATTRAAVGQERLNKATQAYPQSVQQAINAGQSRIKAFAELAKKAPIGAAAISKRFKGHAVDTHQLALDTQNLVRAGINQPVLEQLQELEQDAPGTIRNLMKRGIAPSFVTELNDTFRSLKNDQAVIDATTSMGKLIGSVMGQEAGAALKASIVGFIGPVAPGAMGPLVAEKAPSVSSSVRDPSLGATRTVNQTINVLSTSTAADIAREAAWAVRAVG